MILYHISDTLQLGQKMKLDYKQNMELVTPFVQALNRSEDCFYALLLNAKLIKSVLKKFGMQDMQTNYVKWATEGIFEFIRRQKYPQGYSRMTSNYFYDNLSDITRLYLEDWNMKEKPERFNFHVYEVEVADDAPQKRDMLLFDKAFDAMWDHDDIHTAMDCARAYFAGEHSETPVWEILSDKPAETVKDISDVLQRI